MNKKGELNFLARLVMFVLGILLIIHFIKGCSGGQNNAVLSLETSFHRSYNYSHGRLLEKSKKRSHVITFVASYTLPCFSYPFVSCSRISSQASVSPPLLLSSHLSHVDAIALNIVQIAFLALHSFYGSHFCRHIITSQSESW